MHFLDAAQYAYYSNAYARIVKDHPEYKVWLDMLAGRKSKEFYGNTKGRAMDPLIDLRLSARRFDKELIGNMVYIKVPTFDMYYQDAEGAKIVEYMKNMSDAEKAIVIDIRGNGGGSVFFWIDSIVRPLLSSKVEYRSYELFLGGELSRPFLAAKKIRLSDARLLPEKLCRRENGIFKWFTEETQTIEPAETHIEHRKVYVLMDRSNFSSSESFLYFCKTTGFATLVGQRSSGDGIGFDPILVRLPNTGMIFTIPIDAALNNEGMLDYEYGTEPDIAIDASVDTKAYVAQLINSP